jgi:hypothetical protein
MPMSFLESGTLLEDVMEIMDAVRWKQPEPIEALVPADARFVISVLSGEDGPGVERRRFPRCAYTVPAIVEVSHGAAVQTHRRVYTRDVNEWGVGFVMQDPLPVGKDAVLFIAGADREGMQLRCCILRCREVLPGWYEGAAVLFVAEMRLSPLALSAARRRAAGCGAHTRGRERRDLGHAVRRPEVSRVFRWAGKADYAVAASGRFRPLPS